MAWFYRWGTTIDIFRGDLPAFFGFEEEVTPLWVWEI